MISLCERQSAQGYKVDVVIDLACTEDEIYERGTCGLVATQLQYFSALCSYKIGDLEITNKGC